MGWSGFREGLNESCARRREAVKPAEFLRKERWPLLACTAALILLYAWYLLSCDVHYFYSLLYDDAMYYLLHGWYLLHQHTTALRLADNIAPMEYVGIPGYMRIPLLAVSPDFAVQYRLIQAANIAFLIVVGALQAFLLAACAGPRWRRAALPLMMAMMFLSSKWQLNVTTPMSDSVFAILFCGAMVAIRTVDEWQWDARLWRRLLLAAALVAAAALVKLLGFFLIVYALFCWWPLMGERATRYLARCAAAMAAMAALCMAFLWRTIVAYQAIWRARVNITHWYDWALNLVTVSLPCQIVPFFDHLFSHGFSFKLLRFHWLASERDVALEFVGLGITSLIVAGMVQGRKRLLPEIALLLLFVPVVSPITTSTTRYFAPLQFLVIALFLAGAQHAFPKAAEWVERHGKLLGMGLALIVLAYAAQQTTGPWRVKRANIADTYQRLDNALLQLNPQQARLLYFEPRDVSPASPGKWTLIRGLRYVAPDENLPQLVSEKEVYAVFDYPRSYAASNSGDDEGSLRSLEQWGHFHAELLLEAGTKDAFGRIYRITETRP